MNNLADILPQALNLEATAILDFDRGEVSGIAVDLIRPDKSERMFLQRAPLYLCQMVRPVYSVNEWQPVSRTLRLKQGSRIQRMACLEAFARAQGIAREYRLCTWKGLFGIRVSGFRDRLSPSTFC